VFAIIPTIAFAVVTRLVEITVPAILAVKAAKSRGVINKLKDFFISDRFICAYAGAILRPPSVSFAFI
jgi:hypothetical protein